MKRFLKILCLTLIWIFVFSSLAFATTSETHTGAESNYDSSSRQVLCQINVGTWPAHYNDSSIWAMLFNKASAYDYAQIGFMKSSVYTNGSNSVFIESNDPSIFRPKTFQYWVTSSPSAQYQITFDQVNGLAKYYKGTDLIFSEPMSNFSWLPTYRQYMSEIQGDSYWFGKSTSKAAINYCQYASLTSGWITDTPATWFYGYVGGTQRGYVSSTGTNSFDIWDTRN